MRASRLRFGLVVAAAAAVALGGIVAPSAANAVIVAPTGLSPNDPTSAPTSGTPGTPRKNVVLSWDAMPNTATYQVQVSDKNGTFVSPSIDVTTSLNSFAPSAKLYHADYAWRVRSTGGTWSAPAYFTRGWTAKPGSPQFVGTPDPTRGPVLTWDGVDDASYYEVQIAPRPFVETGPTDGGDGGEDGTETASCFTASTVFTPYATPYGDDDGIIGNETTIKCVEFSAKNISPATNTYYWRVRARDGVFDPATINLKKPAYTCGGVWYSKTPALTETTAECSKWAYPTVKSFNVQAYVNPTLTPAGPKPAQVTGLDLGPRAGNNNAPTPVLASNTPSFTWDAVPNTSFYRVYQTRDKDSETGDHQWETTSNTLAPVIQEADADVKTYWRVEACVVNALDDDGFVLKYKGKETIIVVCGVSSEWQTYLKKTPALTQPVSTQAVLGGYRFAWSTAIDKTKPNSSLPIAVTDAEGYELQVSNYYGSFDSPSASYLIDRQGTSTGTAATSVPKAGLPAGFKWRVRGIDSSGNGYPWSEQTSDSSYGTLASAKGAFTTKSGFALTAPLDFSFNAPVDGVNSSNAKIIGVGNGAAVPGTVTEVANSQKFRFIPSIKWVAGESYYLRINTSVTTSDTAVPAVAAGNTIRAVTSVDSSSSALTKVNGDYPWVTAKASDARGGSYLRSSDKTSTSKRSYVQARVRSNTVSVYACMGPSSGYARIYVDGSVKRTVNLYKSYSKCGKVATVALGSGSQHTVRFAPTGTKTKKAKSAQVRFDGFTLG